ncbi:helix-turn-helix domain-containing protein [Amycolatopsis sp. NPDC051758]|uniref:helix-turn-helix domain-containing protein n=1 Tax=Amycolatopsis sp. NPDC051758 TaxID=3363935 RepID=UPI0037AE870F
MSGTGPAAYRVSLGRKLKALREDRDMDRETVAHAMGWDLSKLSRVDNGQATLKVAEVDKLLDLFSADEATAAELREIGQQARKRGSYGKVPEWSRPFLGLEQDAAKLEIFQGELIPGLFQTEEYARRLISRSPVVAAADVEKVVEARMRRRSLLHRENPPRVHLVLGEAALHIMTGGRQVMTEQVKYLQELADLDHVTMQIFPFSAGEHASLGVGFTFLTLDLGGTATHWVNLEDLTRADCLSGASDIEVYRLTFDSLAINAAGERETIALLEQRIDALVAGG